MKLLTGPVINSAAIAISSGLNFLSVLIWTRLLDPQAFGIYAIVLATALLLNAMVFEWLRLVAARTLYDPAADTHIGPARANALFALYLAACVLFAAVGIALCLFEIGFAEVGSQWWPILVGFTLSEMALAAINTISRVRLASWQYFRSMVSRSVLSLAIGLILVLGMDMEAAGAMLGIVIAQALVAVSSLLLDPLWRTVRPWRATWPEVAAILRFGYPLIPSCALTYASAVADRFLIAGQLGATEVGLYAAPADLLQKTLVFVMMAINVTAYPMLVRVYEDRGVVAAGAALDRNFILQLVLGIPAAVGLAVLAPGLANLLLGAPFRAEGAMLLPFIAIAALLRCLVTFHLMVAFQLAKRMMLMLVPPLTMLIVIIPGAIVGMRSFGLVGMAMAAIAAQAITYAVSAWLAKRVLPIRIVTAETVKVLAAGAIMGAALFPFRDADGPLATLLLVAAGGLIYAAMLLLLRVAPVMAIIKRLPLRRRPA